MDMKATQIISIERKNNKPSKYVLHSDKLNDLLGPIKEKHVSIISIAGPSRQGKSFLLSYMIRYLLNTSDANWIGRSDDPLKGFGWKTDINPQTTGIWFSKPFIVKQSNGKEIAVLLMDTQGVFDDTSDQRDWSTIVGISLLSSSCTIFNVFTNIQEDILMNLESFLQYGRLAAHSNGGFDDEKPFDNLIFLIRDWNIPQKFKYGKTGGKQVLEHKLEIRDDQPASSKTVRRLIKECFKEISCFLMPDPGDKAKEHDFDGCVDHLSSQFVEKMKEFITNLLNPEELEVKMIKNSKLTAGDLCTYLDAYVQIFNSEDLPKPIDIVEATSKTADTILINKLKDSYLTELKSYSEKRQFIERNNLETHSNEYKNDKITRFNRQKRTTNEEIDKELKDLLNNAFTTIYHQIYEENEKRRENILTKAVKIACNSYEDKMSRELGSEFIENYKLDELLRSQKRRTLDIFFKNFEEEDEEVFASHIMNLKEFIENYESTAKLKNKELMADAEKKNSQAVIDAVDAYDSAMQQFLDQIEFISKEQFIEKEKENKKSAMKLFNNNCKHGNPKFIENFEFDVEKKLTESKSKFKSIQQTKLEKTIQNTESQFNQSLKDYSDAMKKFLENICTEKELKKIHEKIKSEVIDQFSNSCPNKDPTFLRTYLEKLEDKINNAFSGFKTELSDQLEEIKKSFKDSVSKCEDIYKEQMNTLFDDEALYIDEKLRISHKDIEEKVIARFQSQKDVNNELKNYLSDLKERINKNFDEYKELNKSRRDSKGENFELTLNRFLTQYEEKMKDYLKNTSSEQQLIKSHEEVKSDMINQFQDNCKIVDPIFTKPYLEKFEEKIDQSFRGIMSELIEQLEIVKNTYKKVVTESLAIYKKGMDSLFSGKDFISDENLIEFHNNYQKDAIDNISSQNDVNDGLKKYLNELEGLISEEFDKFKLINKSRRDLEEKNLEIKSNDILAEYEGEMREFLKSSCSQQQLVDRHEEIKCEKIKQIQDICSHKDPIFLKPYIDKFEKKIKNALKNFKSELSEQSERAKNSCEISLTESKAMYKKIMEELFSKDEFYSDTKLNSFHEDVKEKAISSFQSKTDLGNEVENYLLKLKPILDEEFEKFKVINKLKRDLKEQNVNIIINEFLTKYENLMEKLIESAESKETLLEKEVEVSKTIIQKFTLSNPFQDSITFEPYLKKLEDMIQKSLKDSIQIFEQNMKTQDSLFRILISDARKFYRDEMHKLFQNINFVSNQKLNSFSESVVERTISKFESEKGNLSPIKYGKMIEESLEDIFQEIKEVNNMNTPTIPAIGIDLGTTFSCVAYFKPRKSGGDIIVIPNELGKNTTASCVAFSDTHGELVGDVAKEEAFGDPRNTLFLAKRLIGRKFNDTSVQEDMKLWAYKVVDDGKNNPQFSVKYKGKNKTFCPEEISAKILKKMKQIAENRLQCKVTKAVITVPAYFNDSQKQATRDAGKIAGLEVLKIINEPTAASIAFKLNRREYNDKRNVLIFDFGGGTFDVAVLQLDRTNIETKAVGGDNHLGGDDFDMNMVNYCLKHFESKSGLKVRNNSTEGSKALIRLKNKCEAQKCNLSAAESTIISLDSFFDNQDLSLVMTRKEFEELNDHLFTKAIDIVEKTLEDAKMKCSDIDDIVLVGGSTRIPRVQKMLSELFNKPLNYSVNPDEAVAIGAAIQAAILNGDQAQQFSHLQISDVLPMSLGIEVVGGIMSTILPRNTKVPNNFTQRYIPSHDYQTSIRISIFEGEETFVKSNHLLGEFNLTGIPPDLAHKQDIDVTFDIDDEGILHVKAKIMSTGGEEEIEIQEHKGRLTPEELAKLIEEGKKKHFLWR